MIFACLFTCFISNESRCSWVGQNIARRMGSSDRQRHDTLQAFIGPFEIRK